MTRPSGCDFCCYFYATVMPGLVGVFTITCNLEKPPTEVVEPADVDLEANPKP